VSSMPNAKTNRWLRMLKHSWLDVRDVQRALDADALARIEQRVAASERRHSGEIRVCVEAGLPWSYLWKRLSARDRAIMLFAKLRVWDTAANNGVLIYLLLAEHAIEIVADRGLSAQVGHEQWQAIVDGMREAFRAGRFEEGLNAAVDAVDALLALHFPPTADRADADELPNTPMLL
jgi:uncharacterized membrane protein